MEAYLVGAAGMLLTLAAFVAGLWIGKELHRNERKALSALCEEDVSDEAMQTLAVEKKRMKEDSAAFQQLINYNTSTAYKMGAEEDDLR